MTGYGIERIGLYTPRFSVSALELAAARGRDPEVARVRYLVDTRSVAPAYEDTVTLAVNAARRVLRPEDAKAVRLLIVATESGVDFGKPVSTWVHRFCSLSAECRNFELKHACYAGTAALKMAIAALSAEQDAEAKALVVCADLTRPFPQEGYDFAGGAVAVALLVSRQPGLLAIDTERCGYWTSEVADTFRPTASSELGDNEISLCSYLDALDGSYEHYIRRRGACDYESEFDAHIYHAPFPGMTREAHRCMLSRDPQMTRERMTSSFESKVMPGLHYARQLGTAYGASNFISLLGLLHSQERHVAPGRVSFYSYGSGCQAEFYDGLIPAGARESAQLDDIDRQIAERKNLSIEEYNEVAQSRQASIDQPCFRPLASSGMKDFDEMYNGRHLLVLDEIRDFRRAYAWS